MFYLSLNSDFYVYRVVHLWAGSLPRGPGGWVSEGPCGAGGGDWSAAGWLKPPSNFIAGRPKAAILFWFFGDFRCGVPLFIVMLGIY